MHPGNPVEASAMPSTPGEILKLLRKIIAQAGSANQVTVYLEQVGGFIPGRPQPASRAFNFGMGYGFIQGFLMAMDIRTELVTPQRWQASLHMGNSHGLAKAEWKRKLKVKAEQLYPGLSITLATCDAVLILDYAMRQLVVNPSFHPQEDIRLI